MTAHVCRILPKRLIPSTPGIVSLRPNPLKPLHLSKVAVIWKMMTRPDHQSTISLSNACRQYQTILHPSNEYLNLVVAACPFSTLSAAYQRHLKYICDNQIFSVA